MNKVILVGFLGLFISCSSKITKEDLEDLNGYWEISKVTLPGGKVKEYNVNTSVDFISIANGKGYRKKMQPKLDGTYKTSDDAEEFQVIEDATGFSMAYKTELSEWTEQLMELDETAFSVKNEDGIRYDYKRFEPIAID